MQAERWKQVEALFEAAQQRPADERAEFLRQACPDDPELCAEVESLLKAAESRDPLLDGWRLSSIAERPPALKPGDKLGNFEIVALIGRGGMGEVYRARDLRLKREVAIKTLPSGFAAERDRIARFEREARAASALNHPNIVGVHDVGTDGGVSFIVSELVEGETLAQAIQRGPLPLRKLIDAGTQICDGLAAAHIAGVVHRDLKPGNIMLTRDGRVKILDFGLARQVQAPGSDSTTIEASHPGVIMGTPGYMSPEQVRGEPTDARSDIFGLGVILYEMASGKRAFTGGSSVEVMNSILKDEPPELPPASPPALDRIIRRCIEKQPSRRFQTAADLGFALTSPSALLPGEPPRTTRPVAALPGIRPWPAVAGALMVALAIALWALWRASRPVEQHLLQLDVDLGPEISLRPLGDTSTNSVIISPDGTRLVYVASVAGGPLKLFTRRLDQPKASELSGTEGAFFPFFSPDGQWVGFDTALYKLRKIPVEGGAAVSVGDMDAWGASWGEDGSIIASRLHGDGMVLIPSSGGGATLVTELASGEAAHGYPQFLPGGKAVLFTVYRGPRTEVDKATIEVVSLPDRHRKVLVRGGASPHYVAAPSGAGHLVYSNKGTLFAVPFDLNRLETRGTAVAVLDGVAYEPINAAGHFDVSRTGTLVYRKASSGGLEMTTIQWLDGAGRAAPLLTKPGPYEDLRLSPDGKRLAVQVLMDLAWDVWVYDLQRDAMTRLTFGEGGQHLFGYGHPIWSPDGRYVVFRSYVSSMSWTRADGAGQPQQLTRENNQTPWSFSPDGKRLAYFETDSPSGAHGQIFTVPVEDGGGQLRAGKPEQFLKTQFIDCCPAFSPDGKYLAYVSNESGTAEVYVRPFPPPASGQGGKWQISNSGGESPMWSRNGRELLYQSGDQIMAVNYTAQGGTFLPEKPRVWLSKLGGATSFDLGPDGKRLAVLTPIGTPEERRAEHEVTLLFSFFDELRRRVPVGN